MKDFNQFIWELCQESEDDSIYFKKIFGEFKKTEDELLKELKSGEPLTRDLLQYRNQLNKLLAKTPPFIIEEYNFMDKYGNKKGEDLK